MNRLDQLFKRRKHGILSVYFTAGYPQIHSTLPILEAIQAAGGDIAEIGFPFSDPLADGPVIQASNDVALKNGMNLHRLLQELKAEKERINLPLVLMGYFNPVLRMGIEDFVQQCQDAAIDGVILPDVPLEYWENGLSEKFRKADIHTILLIGPGTNNERLKRIDNLSSGFLYAVAMKGITGGHVVESQTTLERFKTQSLNNHVLAGFGIHDKTSFETVCNYTSGAIIGSAFIQSLRTDNYAEEGYLFLKQIR